MRLTIDRALTAAAIAACVACCHLPLPALAQDAAAPVKFTFAPPTPLTYVEESVTRRATIISGQDAGDEEATVRIKTTVTKEGEGFKISAEPQSSVLTRGGKPVKDKVWDVLSATPVTYHLDPAGKLKSIEGYAGVLAAASKVASRDVRKTLEAAMSEKSLVEKETAQWNSRIGDFIGREAVRNSVWVTEGVYPLPGGTAANFFVVTLFDRVLEQDGRKLARLRFFLTADRDTIQTRVNDMARDVVKGVPRPRPLINPPGFAISGQGERLVDPATMIVYSEKSTREILVSLPGRDKDSAIPVLIQETRQSKMLPGAGAAEPAKN